ncbi:MAG TPA: hypothetical protein VEZ72_17280 [Paenibacillus sp.]|nr:hypothetical protein [Paenibacillus sp.]
MIESWIRKQFRALHLIADRRPWLGLVILVAASASLAFAVYEFGKDVGRWFAN